MYLVKNALTYLSFVNVQMSVEPQYTVKQAIEKIKQELDEDKALVQGDERNKILYDFAMACYENYRDVLLDESTYILLKERCLAGHTFLKPCDDLCHLDATKLPLTPKCNSGTIYYFKSDQQKDSSTCGYRAALNAPIIKRFLEHDKISLKDAQAAVLGGSVDGAIKELSVFLNINTGEWLGRDHLYALAEKFNIRNFYVLACDSAHDGTSPTCYYDIKGGSDPKDLSKIAEYPTKILTLTKKTEEDIIADLQKSTPTAHFFVCHKNNNHWVLIVVAKLPKRDPVIIIMDSQNYPITGESSLIVFIDYIHNKFVAPFYKQKN